MKKVFLMAYARQNLGDDLFIKMLLDRYPMHNFYMKHNHPIYLEKFKKYSNFHFIKGNDTDEELFNSNIDNYDMYIYVGGSIFMEGGKVYNLSDKFFSFIKKCKETNKPFCYLSCNYGPYFTEEYFKLSNKTFNTCTDICFRDIYSYNLFKNIPNVRYAPDLAFTYPIKYEDKIKNSIGITVIDLDIRPKLYDKKDCYLDMMINNIENYLNCGKKVYIFSFCKYEGDEKTINILLNKIKNTENIVDIRFDGNIEDFMQIYTKMEYMICARFHAMILSTISKQKMFIMSYSKKIDNVVNDLELKIPILKFEDINNNTKIELNDFVSVNENNISSIIDKAKEQEKIIKKILI